MNPTHDRDGHKAFPLLRRSYRRDRVNRPEALEALGDGAGPPKYVRNPARELAGLENRTDWFRRAQAWALGTKLRAVRQRAALALEEWTDVVSGESPAMPCKNEGWRSGSKAPPSKIRRCESLSARGERCAMLRGHEGDHRKDRSRVSCECALCIVQDCAGSEKYFRSRRIGQWSRFDNVRACGSRMRVAGCGVCGTDMRAVPEGCGVRRVCAKCDLQGAIKRRARFGRARGRAFINGHRYGLLRRNRRHGRYSEKMLTLTIPHALRAESTGIVFKEADGFLWNDLAARVCALFAAWKHFLKKVNRHWKTLGQMGRHVVWHRAFEWTPGKSDAHGHPHFHVYLWSPFLDRLLVRAWWAESLREVGWPVEDDADGNPKLSTRIQMLRSNGVSEVRELMKGGRRSALTLSRVEFENPSDGARFRRGFKRGHEVGPGLDAFKYAEGWSLAHLEECSDETRARLYMALEGRRMTQASAGFFLDDDPCSCERCGSSGMFRVRFQPTPIPGVAPSTTPVHVRGPP